MVGELADPPDFGSGVIQVRALATQLHACLVITAARRLGTAVVRVQFPEQAPCDRSVQRFSTRLCRGRSAGSNPAGHSRAVLAQWQEALRSDRRGSGFESLGRYSQGVNRTSCPVYASLV